MDWYSFALGVGFGCVLAIISISGYLLASLREAAEAYDRANALHLETLRLLGAENDDHTT